MKLHQPALHISLPMASFHSNFATDAFSGKVLSKLVATREFNE